MSSDLIDTQAIHTLRFDLVGFPNKARPSTTMLIGAHPLVLPLENGRTDEESEAFAGEGLNQLWSASEETHSVT